MRRDRITNNYHFFELWDYCTESDGYCISCKNELRNKVHNIVSSIAPVGYIPRLSKEDFVLNDSKMSFDELDPTFEEDLLFSSESVERIRCWLENRGYLVEVPELVVRPDEKVMSEYSDDGDLLVSGGKIGEQVRIEVKHRVDMEFTSLDDFPYSSIIVDVCHAWDKADPKPYAYFILNKDMTAAIYVHGTTSERWMKKELWDRKRNRFRKFYMCSLHLCKLLDVSVVF